MVSNGPNPTPTGAAPAATTPAAAPSDPARPAAAPPPPSHRPPASLALILAALTPFSLGYLFSYLYRAANAVVAPDLVAELHLSASELGLLTAAYLAAFAAFQLPLGVLLDRYGPRRVQAALVALGAAGALLFSVGRDVTTLTVARAMIGVAFSGGLMSSFKAVVIWVSEPRRALANACLMSLGGLGLLIATTPLELAAQAVGWRTTFRAMAAVTLLVALLILFIVPERGLATSPEPLRRLIGQVGRIYRDRVFLALVPFIATTSGTHIALQTLWAGPWFRDIGGLDRLGVANALLVMAAAFVASILLAGGITDWLVRRGWSLLASMLLFQLVFLAAQVGLLLEPAHHWAQLAVWSTFGMTGHVSVIAYPWLARYFGPGLSGRSNTAANLLLFLWAFVVQYGVGAIIAWFPASPAGGYAPEAYRAAIAAFLAVQLVALVWLAANRRRLAAAETTTG